MPTHHLSVSHNSQGAQSITDTLIPGRNQKRIVDDGNFTMVLRSVDTQQATGQTPAEKAARARQHDKPIAEHLRLTDES